MQGKRGQFTIIVVIGIIALLAISGFFYLKSAQEDRIREDIPEIENKDPIKGFVQQCISAVAKEAILKLGEHSGYIDPENIEFTGKTFTNARIPTLSDGVEAFGRATFTPYWHYLKSSNTCEDCVFASHQPSMEEIEDQISKYVDINLDSCLQNFQAWEQIKNIQPAGNIRTITKLEPGHVRVKVNYPLDITTQQATTTINDFETKLDLDLKNIYETASEIVEKFTEDDVKYLEKTTLMIIAVYSMGENSELPPIFGGTDLETKPYAASKPEAEKLLKSVLQDNLPLISVSGAADNIIPLTNSNLTNAITRLMVPSLDDDALGLDLSSLNIDFSYFESWPIYLDIKGGGSSGSIIESEMQPLVGLGPIKLPIYIRNMDFVYDVGYPVIIEITDNSAFNGEGYRFKFGMEVNIKNNDWNFSVPFEDIQNYDEDYGATLFCDQRNRNSGIITINVRDSLNRKVAGANVLYRCGAETCFIGTSDENGVLEENFPVCAGGYVFAEKEDYYGIEEALGTSMSSNGQATVKLHKAVPVDVVVKKRMVSKTPASAFELASNPYAEPAWTQTNVIEDLHIDENTAIVLTRIGEPEFMRVVNYNGTLAPAKVELIPGVYDVKGVVARNFNISKGYTEDSFIIPEETVCVAGGGCQTIPELSFNDSMVLGGIEEIELHATEDDLNKNLILYVSSVDLVDIEKYIDLTGMTSYTEMIQQDPSLFTPEFVSG